MYEWFLWQITIKVWIKGTTIFFQFIPHENMKCTMPMISNYPILGSFFNVVFFICRTMHVHQNVILKIPIKGTTRLYNRFNFSSVSLLSVIRWPCWDYITCCVHCCCLLTIVNQLLTCEQIKNIFMNEFIYFWSLYYLA